MKSGRYEQYDARTLLGKIYFSSLGSIFAIAFVSYYVQFPGLVSSYGIEPAWRSFSTAFPNINKWLLTRVNRDTITVAGKYDSLAIEIDILCEIVAVLGIFLSCVAARFVWTEILLYCLCDRVIVLAIFK